MAAQTILIAEDDPDIRDGVRILLAGEGYHILEAENGTRALEIFNPEVDLVILDIMMPGRAAASLRGAAQGVHGAHPVPDGKIAGIGQAAGPDGGRR